jgi:hypothetical protein
VFVKVKRSQTLFTYELECLHRYRREIASLHRVALTRVTAREFWVRHPKGNWQFFLVRHESVIEIRADGTYTPSAALPIITGEPAGEDSSPGRDDDLTSENER